MTDGRERRLAALRTALEGAGLDALLVSSLPNIRYLSGFSGSSALLVVTARDVLLLTDFRYSIQANVEAAAVARVVIEPTSLWARLWSELPAMRDVESIAFESAHVTHADFQRLVEPPQGASRWQWRPAVNLVESLRERKDDAELAHIREAVRIAEHALQRTVERVKAGMTELAICGILEGELRSCGSRSHPFETIVASGERAALPHARSSARAVGSGDFLLVDFGAESGGYCSDITRTFVVGKATEDQREIHDVVRESNATASGGVRAGMRGRDADSLARGYIERRGWGEAFGHSLGHGIGLEVHEAPRLSKANDSPLPVGGVVTIEPGIYRPGWGGVRIEDDVVLTSEGREIITTFPRELIEL
ncbi:MAG: M24 family metallopeptidase [Gemmatimonadales bacterium]